jgi:enoyl-CoA hydratase
VNQTYEHIVVRRAGTAGRILTIVFNRPEVLNALSAQTFKELQAALQSVETEPDVRVIILKGAGRAFSAGHDIGAADLSDSSYVDGARFKSSDEGGKPLPLNFAAALRQITDIMLYFWRIPKVTIVQTHGYCLGGGLEIAMMADLVVSSNDCLFGHPAHRGVGVARNAMLFPLVMGMRKAKELFYTGDTFNGVDAERMGIINYAWPGAELDMRTMELAERVGNLSSDHLAALKAAMNQFYENMGLYSSVYSATRLDAMAQLTESAYSWQSNLANLGLKRALELRDAPYAKLDISTKDRGPAK